jgi:hypothetical protein
LVPGGDGSATRFVPQNSQICTNQQPDLYHSTARFVPLNSQICTTQQPDLYHSTARFVPQNSQIFTTQQPDLYHNHLDAPSQYLPDRPSPPLNSKPSRPR